MQRKPVSDNRSANQIIKSIARDSNRLSSRISGLETAAGGRRFLYVTTEPIVVNQDSTERLVGSVVLPGGLLGEFSLLEIIGRLKTVNQSSTTFTLTPRFYYGARVLSLGPVNIVQTNGGVLVHLSTFLVGAGAPAQQNMFGTIQVSRTYGNFAGVNLIEGSNGVLTDTDSEADQLMQLTIQHNTTDPLLTTTSLFLAFGYPVQASG